MGSLQILADAHGQRLEQARQLFFDHGALPKGLVDPLIIRSWERCRRLGLTGTTMMPETDILSAPSLKNEQERSHFLLSQGRPIMEHVYEQIRESGSMVILANANGLLLETVGDPDFVDRADRVALAPFAAMLESMWDDALARLTLLAELEQGRRGPRPRTTRKSPATRGHPSPSTRARSRSR